MELLERLTAPGPKRLLALDGGGIRGCITIEFLASIESLLRERHSNPELVLSDYFDLIGGTSTGAILAAGLALGMATAELRDLYEDLGGIIFETKKWQAEIPLIGKLAQAKYSSEPLEEQLGRIMGRRTLGDPDIRTGLCIVAKRADTGSTWPLINHPGGKYYSSNQDILLRRAVRASTAAPTFFVPEEIDVGDGQMGAFIDGGVSMANNPALQLFLVATLQGFPFRWPTGADNLLVVSVGTGTWSRRESTEKIMDSQLPAILERTVSGLMDDASSLNQTMLQAISRCPTRWEIDGEIGDLAGENLTSRPLLHYLRYNSLLEPEEMKRLELDHLEGEVDGLRGMDRAERRVDLFAVGAASAADSVSAEHFPAAFDLGGASSQAPGSRSGWLSHDSAAKISAQTDPVLRNLQITQFYHDAGAALAKRIGGPDVTWFGFGVWASDVAGRFINGSGVPKPVRALAAGKIPDPLSLADDTREFLQTLSGLMAEGNVLVFNELAPALVDFLSILDLPEDERAAGLENILASLPVEPGEERSLLRIALSSWARAAAASSNEERAQSVLAGNLAAVYHEQRRLQPILEKATTPPVVEGGGPLLAPLRKFVTWEWRRMSTRYLMQYELPTSKMRVGNDVRAAIRGRSFPPELEQLDHQEAASLWDELAADSGSVRGSRARNWTKLSDRMRFIATLFRARQQDRGLLSPPFKRAETAAIRSGRLPSSYAKENA